MKLVVTLHIDKESATVCEITEGGDLLAMLAKLREALGRETYNTPIVTLNQVPLTQQPTRERGLGGIFGSLF